MLKTQSYFIKRLRDSGYDVIKLYNNYSESDERQWTIVIDPAGASVFVTCYISFDYEGVERVCFEMYDGGQYIPARYRIHTDSMEVFINYLVQFNINNKHKLYGTKPKTT